MMNSSTLNRRDFGTMYIEIGVGILVWLPSECVYQWVPSLEDAVAWWREVPLA